MKIYELIKSLSVFNPNAEVYIASDSEGNWYGTTREDSIMGSVERYCLIFPVEEGLDFDDIATRSKKRKRK